MNGWVVAGVNKAHNNIGIVYRDATQADYELSEVHNSSRRSSGGSTQFDTGESFFVDEARKPRRDLDDVFLFDHPSLKAVPDPRTQPGPPFPNKTLLLLDQSVPTSQTSASTSQELSPTTVLEMWERNETFQDLTQLIEEERGSTSSTPCYLADAVAEGGASGSMSSPTWVPGHPTKRPYDHSMAGPSTSGLPAKTCRTDEPISSPPRVEHYSKMRVRNNEASKRSRMTRKEKEQEMEKKANDLEADNQMLRIQVKNLEELIDTLKKRLINAFVKK